MKTVIIFIGLKIIELVGIAIGYLLISSFGFFILNLIEDADNPECWYNPLYFWFGAMILFSCALMLVGLFYAITKWIPDWIESNWEWSKKLSKRK